MGDNERSAVRIIVAVVILLVCAYVFPSMFETVQSGTYQVRQWPVSGTLDVKMNPGMWAQCFGSITTWPCAETFYFTADTEGSDGPDDMGDASIEVTFNDGSTCRISGTCRVEMPKSPEQALNLITKLGLRSHIDVEEKLVKPCLRNALILTANLMSARESYCERRNDFIVVARDQIQHGLYEVVDEQVEISDPLTGQQVVRTLKRPAKDKDGRMIRQPQSNVFEGTGIVLSNFEVKKFIYSDAVQKQIDEQQKAAMEVVTAIAKTKKSEQDSLRIEAEGKASVMASKYEKEQEKVKAVTDALKDKEVAITKGEQQKAVASLERDAAEMNKQRDILLGEGEATRKKLVMAADGALEKKLAAWSEAQKFWADAFSKRLVPSVVMGDKQGGQDSSASDFMSLMTVKAAKDLSLDMTMSGKGTDAAAGK
jgi:regulator of protease activity HflC (stomatin/prohibitin superfamily)